MAIYHKLKVDGKIVVGEFAWKSQKGDWDFFRVDGQLRAIFRKDVIGEYILSSQRPG